MDKINEQTFWICMESSIYKYIELQLAHQSHLLHIDHFYKWFIKDCVLLLHLVLFIPVELLCFTQNLHVILYVCRKTSASSISSTSSISSLSSTASSGSSIAQARRGSTGSSGKNGMYARFIDTTTITFLWRKWVKVKVDDMCSYKIKFHLHLFAFTRKCLDKSEKKTVVSTKKLIFMFTSKTT